MESVGEIGISIDNPLERLIGGSQSPRMMDRTDDPNSSIQIKRLRFSKGTCHLYGTSSFRRPLSGAAKKASKRSFYAAAALRPGTVGGRARG
jgi:hypothetical protein